MRVLLVDCPLWCFWVWPDHAAGVYFVARATGFRRCLPRLHRQGVGVFDAAARRALNPLTGWKPGAHCAESLVDVKMNDENCSLQEGGPRCSIA